MVEALGALLRVTLGELVAELGIGFTPVAAQSLPVHEAAPSAADLPLGTLLENEKARAVLAKVLGPMLESPMLAQMKSMSLKKLLSMGGQALPPEVLQAGPVTFAAVNYHREIPMGDTVELLYAPSEEGWYVQGRHDGRTSFECYLKIGS